MPPITRWLVRGALVCLVAALALGTLVATVPVAEMPPVVGALGPTWVHLLVVGWLTQLAFGVALWMFPRATPEVARWSSPASVVAAVSLWIGLALRVLGEPGVALAPGSAWGWVLVASAVLQTVAAVAFVAAIWPRVRGR